MKRISIERYKTPVAGYSGLIEGETDAGEQWIMYIAEDGTPLLFWPKRDESGAVIGMPIQLERMKGKVWGTSDHPMTYEEMVAQPRAGLCGSTEE